MNKAEALKQAVLEALENPEWVRRLVEEAERPFREGMPIATSAEVLFSRMTE